MPVLASGYRPPIFLQNGHIQTVYAALLRKKRIVPFERERMATADGDFLDLDWLKNGSKRLLILQHGLEGNTGSRYILGMSTSFFRRGWDVLAWNYRGCSGVPNKSIRSYHSGETGDLHAVIQHALNRNDYRDVALIGFSLGGNVTVKYLGERGTEVPTSIKGAVVFSVPCDLEAGAKHLEKWSNRGYLKRFIRSLKRKIRDKDELLPGNLDTDLLDKMNTFQLFDDRYTAPIHGFKDAKDYWSRSSSVSFIPSITIPTLIVNAADDPFLPPSCYPVEQTQDHPDVTLELPRYGGHVGFVAFFGSGEFWSEKRAADFLDTTTGS